MTAIIIIIFGPDKKIVPLDRIWPFSMDHLTAGNFVYTLSNHYSADFKLSRFDDKVQHSKLVFG